MLDWVTADVLSTGGLSAIVGGVLVAIFRGWLVPKTQVDRMESSYRKQLEDAWASSSAHSARADMLLAQQQRLLEIAYLTRDAATRRLEGMTDELA